MDEWLGQRELDYERLFISSNHAGKAVDGKDPND